MSDARDDLREAIVELLGVFVVDGDIDSDEAAERVADAVLAVLPPNGWEQVEHLRLVLREAANYTTGKVRAWMLAEAGEVTPPAEPEEPRVWPKRVSDYAAIQGFTPPVEPPEGDIAGWLTPNGVVPREAFDIVTAKEAGYAPVFRPAEPPEPAACPSCGSTDPRRKNNVSMGARWIVCDNEWHGVTV